MGRIIWEVVKEEGKIITQYRCRKDGTILWEELQNGESIKGTNCKHYHWEPVGNGCYPDVLDEEICKGVEEITEKRIKKIDQGTTIWFLVPNQ